ncbi:MAG: hypothetical protein Q8882_08110, partial [Bacillota bacterium]|nr:hypothetical protein [Bacillota bacterium]
FSCKVLEAIYDHDIYISRKNESKGFADISVFLLYTIVVLSPFVPGYVSFAIIMLMFLAFMAGDRSGKIKAHRFTDFDILLCMFCFIILSVASVGRNIFGVISVWLVFGSFTTLYFVTVHLISTRARLYKLKFAFCLSGATIAVFQLAQHILPFEMRILGQIYVLSVPMAVELFMQTKSIRDRCILVPTASLMLYALTVTWSGGTWVWATFILAFFIVMRDWRLLLIGGLGLLFVPFIMPAEIIDFHALEKTGLLEYLFRPSAGYRISAYNAISRLLEYYKDYSMTGRWHSSVIVFFCVAVVFILMIREILATVKRGQLGMMCAILAAVGSGVTGFLYSDIVSGIWNNYKTLFVFWVFTSLYSAQARLDEGNPENRPEPIGKIAGRFCFIDTIPMLLAFALLLSAI